MTDMELQNQLCGVIDAMAQDLASRADDIFDHPECDGKEFRASSSLCQWLESEGFSVEKGLGGWETSFRAVYEQGQGGPSIGFLTEYDALIGIGHACGHHLQSPSVIAAALALKQTLKDKSYRLVIYGTPAEETTGAKIGMAAQGCFRDIDVALMMHGAPDTCVDVKSMACREYVVTYHGERAHAAMGPEKGRSALDAVLLTCQAVEFLREHVKEDTRMHYSIVNGGGPSNAVPALASLSIGLRSYSTAYLESVVARFMDIVRGACLMTGTTCDIDLKGTYDAKVPVPLLNDLLMAKANELKALRIKPPREKTGSTDFGNVMHIVPGSCIRVAFVPEGSIAHTQTYLDFGKTQEAHDALVMGSKILACAAADLITKPETLQAIKDEFAANLAKEAQ